MMVTHETLKEWHEKCSVALKDVLASIDKAKDHLVGLEKQRWTVEGQIVVLETLMDIENNPPTIELPFAKDKIQELHDKRLDDSDKSEDVYRNRQENVYRKEALDTAEQIDRVNRAEKDNLAQGNS